MNTPSSLKSRKSKHFRIPTWKSLGGLLGLTAVSAFVGSPAYASEAVALPKLGSQELNIIYIVLLSAFIALGYGAYLIAKTMKRSAGSPEMKEVAGAIEEGAMAYLTRQVKTMLPLVILIAIALFFLYKPLYGDTTLALGVSIAFVLGIAASYLAGFTGMKVAVKGNVRTANAALTSFKDALETAFGSGTVSGMMTIGLGLLGAGIIFLIFREKAMYVLVGFGFGGCLAALFMRVGGGIFTKAADVGADLVGKVEKGIPEDDPRNAATIADNVGDNVGDCAGMAADVFESYEVTLVAAIILAASVFGTTPADKLKLIMYPLLVRVVGVFASIIGTWVVKGKDTGDQDPMQPINHGFWLSGALATIGFGFVAAKFLGTVTVGGIAYTWDKFFFATFAGIILAMIIGRVTEYYTSTEKRPVKEVAYSTKTGPATMILTGFGLGLESSVMNVICIAATIFASVLLFKGAPALAAYGIALSGLGLLTTTGYILAMDTFGPISDNANGIFEMSGALQGASKEAQNIVAKLDAVGNTTKALTKGFAIATAVIAATALFRSFMADAQLGNSGIRVDYPEVFIGMLIGGAVPFLFSSFAIKAVSRAAFDLVQEVRDQFHKHPGIMDYTEKPDYSRCVAISTAAAQKELLGPGVLAICTPILVAFGMGYTDPMKGAMALGGYLAGTIVTGQLMAVMLSNSGGAWDNGKKLIEDGILGGKGSEAHKAAVIGDTVGDPFKDTAGPALNPMIKVMNLVAVLVASAVITPIPTIARTAIVIVTAVLLVGAVAFSKRGKIQGMD